ncbi:hypothetical protein F4815DRAFT_488792 [Daldinia loculata]|nr:hypothetical protein F4815DRAFT_488792 [Daldinia loculata]
MLKPLLVCKRWYFIGVHAFYGANTFAFSSLGEWHRFCNGIGTARVQRLVNVEHGANTFAFSSLGEWHRFCNGIGTARVQRLVNVELMWHGALMPKHETRISQRTLGLKCLVPTKIK